MTDKSFGDHMNRNIVKNPLLSTAVTGLSIEDLTHNAVLLPVSHSQEVITRPDQHFGTQTRPLGSTEHVISNFPFGDANSNPLTSKPPSNITLTPLGTNQTIKTEKLNEKSCSTQSKASIKSEDDFDVNEYFARLQGTRYVSAPLNSSIKDDKNANLEETEDNLEEINLNEPEKLQTDIQQSLTADIAQNFSQLPTVLPQVASAVFSSFSNMLNLKSREQTPDDVKPTYRDIQMPRAEETVPLMGVSDVKEMAPPPKEPPTTGTSNYRLATKMRYAKIPGLSYAHIPDNQNPFANIPISQNTPSYFVPNTPGVPENPTSVPTNVPRIPANSTNVSTNPPIVPTNSTELTNVTNITPTSTPDVTKTFEIRAVGSENIVLTDISDRQIAQKDMYNFYNPAEYSVQNIPEQPKIAETRPAFAAEKVESNIYMTEQMSSTSQGSLHRTPQEAAIMASTQSNAGIIPPPPMFSNLPRRDSQSGSGKMILPPSVARRISSNHPAIKPQASRPIYPENIFVPTIDSEYVPNIPVQNYELQNIKPPSAFAPFSAPALPQDTTSVFTPSNVSKSVSSSSSIPVTDQISSPILQSGDSLTGVTSSSLPQPQAQISASQLTPPSCQESLAKNLPPPPGKSGGFTSTLPPTQITSANMIPPSLTLISPVSNMPSASHQAPSQLPPSHLPTSSNLVPNIRPPPKSISTPPKSSINLSLNPVSEPSPEAIFTPASQNQSETNILPPPFFDPSTFSSNKPEMSIKFQANMHGSSQHQSEANPFPPTFFNPSTYTSSVPTGPPQSEAHLPPPNFFDPSSLTVNEPKDKTVGLQPLQPVNALQSSSPTEPSKTVIEPPKAAGNICYRMTKKRPQYYSGPIEGFGSISNNVKPVLQPVGTSVFQGAVFTPPAQAQQIENQTLTAANTDQSSVPFDQSGVNTYSPFNVTQETNYNQSLQPEYNTAFDLSRATTENYEPPKEESKGFGIIGSLKSKLSALDINKIQNSVTTFFDPAYNDSKKETAGQQENVPVRYGHNLQEIQGQNNSASSYNQYSQNQSSNFEIFVPNVEQTAQSKQSYDYQSYQAPNASYNPAQENQQFYQQQHPYNYYQNLGQDPPTFSYYTLPAPGNAHVPDSATDIIDRNVQEWYAESYSHSQDAQSNQPNIKSEQSLKIKEKPETAQAAKQDNYENNKTIVSKVESNPIVQSIFQKELDSSAKTFFDITQPLPRTEEMKLKVSDAQPIQDVINKAVEGIHNVDKKKEGDEIQSVSFQNFNLKPLETVSGFFEIPIEQEAKDDRNPFTSSTFEDSKVQADENKISAPILDVSSVALLGLSTMLADKSRELSDLEHDIKTFTLNETDQDIDTIFNRGANVSFFDNLNLNSQESVEPKALDEDDKNNLNMCETCREVIKPEDRDTEDLTTQLIENIIAPIQLSNPVVVPFTESNNTLLEDATDFNTKQCAEISHITEETIETIQVQSATELLEEDQLNDSNLRSYGWCSDNKVFNSAKPIEDHNYSTNSGTVGDQSYSLAIAPPAVDHNYSLPNPSAIGFFGKDMFEDIPNNASDEIKAEFQITHEDAPPALLPRQMSIPSAPPADEDSKSDETGIDVHSIEQDAKKDFPIYDEYVIEPSETDDDKIEYKEREKSSDEVQEDDSFTNRVERSKKFGETSDSFDFRKSPCNIVSTTSPPIQMASYFDTGNYAADTHYKNSWASSRITLGVRVSNNSMRIPPGFEEEYQRRLSGAVQEIGDLGYVPVPLIPDTSTQTRHVITPTFTSAQTSVVTTTASVGSSKMSEFVHHRIPSQGESEKFPSFDSIFGIKRENEQAHVFGEIETKLDTPTTTKGERVIEKPTDQNELNKIFEAITPQTTHSELSDLSSLISINKEESPRQFNVLQSSSAFFDLKSEIPEYTSTNESEKSITSANVFAVKTKPPTTDPDIITAIHKNYKEIPIVPNPVVDKPDDILLNQYVPITPLVEKRLPVFAEIIGSKSEVPSSPFAVQKESENLPEKPLIQNVPTLPDPINFFSNNDKSSTTKKSNEDDSFNRLASYFTSPTKTDSTKSFFELSLGQNHHRQDSKQKHEIDPINLGSGDSKASNSKSFFELSQSQDHYIDNNLQNIPQDKYIANLNLMRDLTSIQNVEVNQDQVVRTVNYFTVEYNNEHLDFTQEYNIGEPENSKRDTESKPDNHKHTEVIFDDETALRIIHNCNCCHMNTGYVRKIEDTDYDVITNNKFKVKRAMDNSEQASTQSEHTMEPSKETVNRDSIAINFGTDSEQRETSEGALMGENRSTTEYTPVKHHWFYRVDVEGKSIWRGFSVIDSKALEEAYHSSNLDDNTLVPTDGGRFDVNVIGRLRIPVYWTEKPTNVRRCSWFYKGTTDARYVPYSESVAEKLEEEYRHGLTTGEWHRRLVLPSNELVVMHGPAVMVHFLQSSNTDAFSSPPLLFNFGKRVYRNPPKIRVSKDQPERIDHLILLVHGAGEYRHQKEKETFQSTMRPRVVRRGCEETEIEDIEPSNIDHLLLLCHGVGSACDMRFRAVEEVVDDFRAASLQLIQSHYKNSFESGNVGRVEVLPISWHTTLHSGETGVDRRLARITLDSIPRLRSFTNDTVLDVLFYTSPVFCQTIIDTVCKELNRIYKLFCARNPNFTGGVSLGGHSLGSVILYDLLCHQSPMHSLSSPTPSEKKYISGNAGTGQPYVKYPILDFEPVALYALGSPIAIFECIRGVESLGSDFSLPTCSNFFNIFHPYDPIAYRIEPLIDPQLRNVKPLLIPHHKGRKRMHLELKDTMARVGADIKQKLIESIKTTWSNMWKTQAPPPDCQLEKVVEEEMEKEQLAEEGIKDDQSTDNEISATPEMLGKLNSGRRIDYVLQEAPFEMINEYLFAMSSHVCYWESEDTMLLMLREIYDSLGVQPDSTVPTPGFTVQRTRLPRPEETTVMNVSEHPSTSRDGT